MDLNPILMRDTTLAQREGPTRLGAATVSPKDAVPTAAPPSSRPDHDGVRAAFDGAAGREGEKPGGEALGRERLARVATQRTTREVGIDLASARLPTNAVVSIELDPDTQEARFSVRNRETGDLLREVPERDLAEVLRGGAGSGALVDRLF